MGFRTFSRRFVSALIGIALIGSLHWSPIAKPLTADASSSARKSSKAMGNGDTMDLMALGVAEDASQEDAMENAATPKPSPTPSFPNPEKSTVSVTTSLDGEPEAIVALPTFVFDDFATWNVYDHYDNPLWDDSAPEPSDASNPAHPLFHWKEPYADERYYDLDTAAGLLDMEEQVFGPDAPRIDGSPSVARFSRHVYAQPVDGGLSIAFLGYGETFKTDWAIAPDAAQDGESVRFDIDLTRLDAHATAGFGIFVNAGVDLATLKGYALYWKLNGDLKGTLELIDISHGTKASALHDGLVGSQRLSNVGSATKLGAFDWTKRSASALRVEIVTRSDSVQATVQPFRNGKALSDADVYDVALTDTGHRGYGPFVNFNGSQHTCPRLSSLSFSMQAPSDSKNTALSENDESDAQCSVTFAADAHGTLSGSQSETLKRGDTIAQIPQALPDEGYAFAYWRDQQGNRYTDEELAARMLDANASFTAVFTPIASYTIHYDSGANGSLRGAVTEQVLLGMAPKTIPTPVGQEGYEFSHWVDEKGTVYTSTRIARTTVQDDMGFTAVFKKSNPFTVTFEADPHGRLEGAETEFVSQDDSPTQVPKPIADRFYVFKYWEDQDGTRYPNAAAIETLAIRKSMAFTAHFDEGAPLSVHYAAGKNGSLRGLTLEMVRPGHAPAQLPAPVPKPNYQFAYWRDQNGIAYDSDAALLDLPIATATTFTAIFELADHHVAYTAGAHGALRGTAHETVVYGSHPQKPPIPVPGPGYTFAYWEDQDETRYDSIVDLRAIVVLSDTSLHAVFERDALDVRFDAGAHGSLSGGLASQSVKKGERVSQIPSPRADSGYRFQYWRDQNGARYESEKALLAHAIEDDMRFIAVFDEARMAVSYVADSGGKLNGAEEYPSVRVGSKLSSLAPAPQPVANDGFRFVEWRGADGKAIDPGEAVADENASMITAIFERDDRVLIQISFEAAGPGSLHPDAATTFTVALDEGGRAMLGQSAGFEEPQLLPDASVDPSARFFGWEDAKGRAIPDLKSHIVSESATLFAVFDTDTDEDGLPDSRQTRIYTVTFEAKGGGQLRGAAAFLVAAQSGATLADAMGGYVQPQPVSTAGKAVFYRFEDADGNEIPNTARFSVHSDAVIYARFADDANDDGIADPIQNKYVLTFVSGSEGQIVGANSITLLGGLKGDHTPLRAQDAVGASINAPNVTANEGFAFVGWTPMFDPVTLEVRSDMTFAAIFQPETRIRFLFNGTVWRTFHAATGTSYANFLNGAALPDPKAPKGYHFIGWLAADGRILSTATLQSWKVESDATFAAAFQAD